ncbi:Uma2 family endonuclease [Gloeobacter kilaueensis]|uniref:Putative restriction endonuclease domain-containing protein n=1 Tax=Gloeobacter kilaueensis (strain ATCC BAA-2537 / CCAP 1431/1 / ULC 316 / JS1) TaxID=1183438 RepID=U5QC41_GLOK1|nr:Uma2 family endonuclease [Gloeobacter kilaueensis]AGY56383.1 hypothetical protein GKIL_0136 [Gloeobacter kilaueensis JS1]
MTPSISAPPWERVDWQSFAKLGETAAFERSKLYYRRGWMRAEMSPVGRAHAEDNGLIDHIVTAWFFSRGVRFRTLVNATFQKTGQLEAQPDLAYYVGETVNLPARSNRPIDLETVLPPALVIEVAATTLEDDLTSKRDLYAEIGVGEYWVVDTQAVQVFVFGPVEGNSGLQPIASSRILTGLDSALLGEALRQGQAAGDAAAMQYIVEHSR